MTLLAASVRRAFGAPEQSPFAIAENVWTTLSQRVHFVLNAQLRGGPYAPYRAVPAYTAMFDACAAWRENTFPLLVSVMREVQRYAHETVAQHYPRLAQALALRDRSPVAAIIAQLERDAGVVVALAEGLTNLVAQFRKANESADAELEKQSQSAWLTLMPKPKRVDEAMRLLHGSWRALASDLATVHAAVFNGHAIDEVSPDDIENARSDWSTFDREATDFIRMASAQQNVLDGFFIAPIVRIIAGSSQDQTVRLQSHRDIRVRPGDRLIVFGAGAVDGRREIVEVTPPARSVLPALWTYAIKTAARPSAPWMTYDGIRWLRMPIASASSAATGWTLATVESCEADGARAVVRVGDELQLDVGARIAVARPDFAGLVVERRQTTTLAGDRFWLYTLDVKPPAGPPPKAVWAGMYRDDG
jgi:hypothetical protein